MPLNRLELFVIPTSGFEPASLSYGKIITTFLFIYFTLS